MSSIKNGSTSFGSSALSCKRREILARCELSNTIANRVSDLSESWHTRRSAPSRSERYERHHKCRQPAAPSPRRSAACPVRISLNSRVLSNPFFPQPKPVRTRFYCERFRRTSPTCLWTLPWASFCKRARGFRDVLRSPEYPILWAIAQPSSAINERAASRSPLPVTREKRRYTGTRISFAAGRWPCRCLSRARLVTQRSSHDRKPP